MNRKYLGPLIFTTIMCFGMMAVLLMVWMLSSLKAGPGVASYLKPPTQRGRRSKKMIELIALWA